ncbi:ATP-grasp domain-containing protein [Klebsiella oxytoca]|nr:ATP-grasp domain-containing protein [Klebsiella oxytoca]
MKNAMKKTILLCGNGLSGDIISTIKSWGYNVLLISEFPDDRGVEYADGYIEANSKSVNDSIVAADSFFYNGKKFDGVISLCWDSAISVAAIAAKYNLFSISLESAKLSTYKDLRSNAFNKSGVPSPKYAICECKLDLYKNIKNFTYPIIIKPASLSSSKGVILIEKEKDLDYGYEYAKRFDKNGPFILNEFIKGSEHSTEGLMIDGKLYLTAISDRIFDYEFFKPNFVEVGDIMPTILDKTVQSEIYRVTELAALSLGIYNGVVKGDLIYNPTIGVSVLELSARLGGPRFGTEMVPLSNGTCILKAAIQQALGEIIDLSLLTSKFSKGMVNRSIFPKPGYIKKISGIDKIKKEPGYYDYKWWDSELKIGDVIDVPENGCGNVGYMIVTGDTRSEALRNADNIERLITIETH